MCRLPWTRRPVCWPGGAGCVCKTRALSAGCTLSLAGLSASTGRVAAVVRNGKGGPPGHPAEDARSSAFHMKERIDGTMHPLQRLNKRPAHLRGGRLEAVTAHGGARGGADAHSRSERRKRLAKAP